MPCAPTSSSEHRAVVPALRVPNAITDPASPRAYRECKKEWVSRTAIHPASKHSAHPADRDISRPPSARRRAAGSRLAMARRPQAGQPVATAVIPSWKQPL